MKTYVGTIAKELWKETEQLLTLGNMGKMINMLELLGGDSLCREEKSYYPFNQNI